MKRYIRSAEYTRDNVPTDYETKMRLAKNPSTPTEVLEMLAEDRDKWVREEVAENSHTPVKVLEMLAGDTDKWVRVDVAKNPNTPVKTLEMLAGDGDPDVRWYSAGNSNTPAKVLEMLANDKDADVRREVASNKSTPAKILEMLANDEDAFVRWKVADNPNTPVEVLEMLANDEDAAVRDNVKNNPNTPQDLIYRLSSKKSRSKSTKTSWKSLVRQLQSEAEEGIDSLYDQTSAGQALEGICTSVEDKLGIWLEPSIQGGVGGIWFYSKEDNSNVASDYDYATYNEQVLDMATSSSTKSDFQKKYSEFLQSILNDPKYAPEE